MPPKETNYQHYGNTPPTMTTLDFMITDDCPTLEFSEHNNTTNITNSIIDAASQVFKLSSSQLHKTKSKCWWNLDCKKALQKKNNLFRIFSRNPTEENLVAYKHSKARARYIVKQAKRDSFKKMIEPLNYKSTASFKSEFGTDPDVGVVAPGRVNLIGEHTDYNEGFVFPMALPLVTILVGRKSLEKEKIRIKTLSRNVSDSSLIEFIIPSDVRTMQPSDSSWVNYVKGVVANFHTHAPGFDAVVVSSVPLGGGLSSSAALEVATYTFLEAITGSFAKSPADKALACQKAEHEFAKVPCGIMDQFISTMGAEGSALLIDCRSLKSTLFPLKNPLVSIVIINSNVKHALTGSEYPARRNQCHSAAKLMKKNKFENEMDEEMRKRVHHVITEIERTERKQLLLWRRKTLHSLEDL
ncbi:Galactokinase, partial [Armadillidium vulgare]